MDWLSLPRRRRMWLGAIAGLMYLEGTSFAQAPAAPDQSTGSPPLPGSPASNGAPTHVVGPEPPSAEATTPGLSGPQAATAAPPAAPAEEKPAEPFAFGDFTWLNGANRQHKALLDSDVFTGSFLLDVNYTASKANPIDNTVVGSTALSRNNEFTLAFLGFGGDLHYGNARGRLMTQFGVRSTLVPRNDVSTNRGQFDLQTALRYVSEANGGVHIDALNGINIDAGIFMSYVGLFSYDNFENWMYLPSFTSDNTPWFFNGVRMQIFTSDKLKIEPWLINGWQTYGKFNELPGFGGQMLYRPVEWLSVLSNDYVGWDTQDNPGRTRFHSDNSIEVRYFNSPKDDVSKAAFSITGDIGGESGDGVTPFGGSGKEGSCTTSTPCTQQFLSWMAYNRIWFLQDHLTLNVGGGMMHKPGRYSGACPDRKRVTVSAALERAGGDSAL